MDKSIQIDLSAFTNRERERESIEELHNNSAQAKPFVKWIGGKTQLLPELTKRLPNFNTYIEPFVGGGAMLFWVLENIKPSKSYISDINPRLINAYKTVRDNPDDLIDNLHAKQEIYNSPELIDNLEGRKPIYYQWRDSFNSVEAGIEQAALFIALNKTCFNGLYRENLKGKFNAHIGGYKEPAICDTTTIRKCSELLQNTEIHVSSFENSMMFVQNNIPKNSLVYLDPPYRSLPNTDSFVQYTKSRFNDTAQIKVINHFKELSSNGYRVMLSNSDPHNTDVSDDFFDSRLSDFSIDRISASRRINCDGKGRGNVYELLVRNF